MRHFLQKKLFSLILLFIAIFLSIQLAYGQLTDPSKQSNIQANNETEPKEEVKLEPPEIVLNDQKVIFSKRPILDEEGWLFPLEEVAAKLQDKVITDFVNSTITIQRFRDKSTIQLNVKNGLVTINNQPLKTLFGYNRIIHSPNAQMVPTNTLVILLGLASKDNLEGKLILNNIIGESLNTVGTVQPLPRKGLNELLVDYLTVTNSFNWLQSQSLFSRRTEVNSGFHNDLYAITSDLILKSGTAAPLINFDSGNVSYYRNGSPFQLHFGDKPLNSIKSPLLGGIVLRGLQVQTKGPLKGSKFVFGTGVLPSSGKILGRNLSFTKYGRLSEIAEWSTSPEKKWQFSIGEASYNDLFENQLVRTKQSGGLFALSVTKTGKFVEADSNLALGVTKDKVSGKSSQGPGADILVRLKPKDWVSFFSKGAYYSPGFYAHTGNPFYHDRNEASFGINISPPRSNIGISHSLGKTNLEAKKPNDYSVTNIFASTTPFRNGPTILTSYSKNESQVSPTRALDNILFPINMTNISSVELDELIERRTNSFFRTSVLKNWRTVNLSSSVNYFTFADEKPLVLNVLGGTKVTKFLSYDLNVNKSINRFFGLQTYLQGSQLYKQIRFGFNVGPILNNKLNFLLQTGALLSKDQNPSSIYSLNLNYQANKKTHFNLTFDKTAYLTSLSALWQYNVRGKNPGAFAEIAEQQSIGKIKGKVLVLEEGQKEAQKNKIVLPAPSRERGLANVRIHLGNYIISTDKDGIFEFPSLTPGVHRIKVEYSDLPSYLTSITPESVDIKVEAGKETNFNFVLAYFGALNGKLQLEGEPPLTLEEEPELQDIRVYLEGTDFEALTTIDGKFILGDVKPGKYKLKVDPEFLPSGIEADPSKEEIEIEVHGKQKIDNIQLPLRFKPREENIKVF